MATKDNCFRVVLGGSWYKRVSSSHASGRLVVVPRHGADNLGFRTTQSGCLQQILNRGVMP